MGVAGLVFEPCPPNFKFNTTFEDVNMLSKYFFDISTGFRYKKKWKRVLRPSIETSMA